VFASSTEEAVACFERERPQVTFLDINLPGSGDGLDLLDAFLKLEPDAYVVMMTSKGDFESVQRAKDAGAHGYILKPFNAQKLTEALLGYRRFCTSGRPAKRKAGYVPPLPVVGAAKPVVSATKEAATELKTILTNWHVVCVGQEHLGISGPLSELECRVSRFENGYAAWSFLEKNPADVLVIDAILPDLDGLYLAEQVAAMMRKKPGQTHVVMVFDNPGLVSEGRLKLAGVTDWLVKPVEPARLHELLSLQAARYRGSVQERYGK
jgi:CheY-like chemotaxis protein